VQATQSLRISNPTTWPSPRRQPFS